jgi:hypothetical protein
LAGGGRIAAPAAIAAATTAEAKSSAAPSGPGFRQIKLLAHHRFKLGPLLAGQHVQQLIACIQSKLTDFLLEILLDLLGAFAELVALRIGQAERVRQLAVGQRTRA